MNTTVLITSPDNKDQHVAMNGMEYPGQIHKMNIEYRTGLPAGKAGMLNYERTGP
jgi:hypothetical protein